MSRILLVFLVFLTFASPAQAAGTCDPGAGWQPQNPAAAAEILRLVNVHRATLGKAPMAPSPSLDRAAIWKAQHMAFYRYMAHSDPPPPVARDAFTRMVDCGYPFSGRGENIGYGFATPASIMAGWLNSAGHRANIEGGFRAIGIGAVRNSAGTWYWAQVFGSSVESAPAPPITPPVLPPCNLPPAPGVGDEAVPKWFWAWANWRLEGSKPASRPASTPKLIPKWAWQRLIEIVARRKGCAR